MSDEDVIRCKVQVVKVQTLAAGGWRVTMDGVDYDAFVELAKAQAPGVMLELAAVALINSEEQYAIQKGSVRKSNWQTAQE